MRFSFAIISRTKGNVSSERNCTNQMYQAVAITVIFLAVLQWSLISVHGQIVPPEAVQFFNNVEDSVQSIANSARDNYRNRQVLWSSCNTDTRCSVYACQPLQLRGDNSLCLRVPGEPVCQVTSGPVVGCGNTSVSTGSYIRLPPLADETKLTCDTQMTICAQKDLDQEGFEKVYANDGGPFRKIAWSMFGASNGVFRIYPGLELRPENCSVRTYDPRKRPWYKAVTGVSKQVIVLLDVGGPMADVLSLAEGNAVQVFTAAQQIVTEFLDTLNEDDILSIYTFDNIGAKVVSKEVLISRNDTENAVAFGPLKQAVLGIKVSSNAPHANLTAALETVLLDGGFQNSTAVVPSLKIILIITGGELAEGRTVTIPSPIVEAATTNQVRTFIYRLNDSSQQADVSKLANLQSVACSLGGSFDQIPRENIRDDPLSALGSFYSYVATVRFSLDGGKSLWVPKYDAFSGVGPVMAVVYPVLDGDYLIGVAAIDILSNEVQETWPGAIDSWRTPADIKQTQGGPLNCSVNVVPEASVCSDDMSSERGLCLDASLTFVNTQIDYSERTCCGCDPNPNPIEKLAGDSSSGRGSIIAVVTGSAAGLCILLLVFIFGYWKPTKICRHCYRRITNSPPRTPPLPTTTVTPPTVSTDEGFYSYL